jgi:predicted NAD-dependent protein-ADP-ribosyltransferase YbiA (DUF1768 family)
MKHNEFDILIDTAVNASEQREFDVSLSIKIEGETWKAYTAYVSHRDILLFCDKGTVTYLVDSYGDRHTAELFNWNKE